MFAIFLCMLMVSCLSKIKLGADYADDTDLYFKVIIYPCNLRNPRLKFRINPPD